MLRTQLLRAGGLGVIEAAARPAWRELERRLRPFVARRVRAAADVDDVVQDVFVRMQRGLGALRDEECFGPWVYRIARSAIAEHRRSRARHPIAGATAPPELALEEPEDEEDAARTLARQLAPFIATLRSPYREALTLTELEGLTQQEAADMLGTSWSGMKSRVQRGRRQLRAALEACCTIALDARGRVVDYSCRPDATPPPGCCCR